MPTATAARASGAMNSGCPLDPAPAPPGNCTECVASNTTGQPASRIIFNPRISTTRLLYPKLAPPSVSTTRLLPVDATFSAARWISCGATNCPFLMLTMRPVRPAASSKSVCRHRNAGICKMSATSAAGSAFTPARIRSPSLRPGPRYAVPLVRLALSKEALKTKSPTASRMPRAMRYTCSSLSITHGPAINTSGLPSPNALYSIGTAEKRLLLRRQPPHPLLVGGPDERRKQRMRMHRLGLELRVELAAQVPRMPRDFADLHVRLVRRLSRNPQPRRCQDLFVLAVEFVAVPVPFDDLARAVGPAGETLLHQGARPA